jgi:hypothetical protein
MTNLNVINKLLTDILSDDCRFLAFSATDLKHLSDIQGRLERRLKKRSAETADAKWIRAFIRTIPEGSTFYPNRNISDLDRRNLFTADEFKALNEMREGFGLPAHPDPLAD